MCCCTAVSRRTAPVIEPHGRLYGVNVCNVAYCHSTVHQLHVYLTVFVEVVTCSGSFQAWPGWNHPGRALGCHQTCMTYTSAECTVENSWWWVEELPETCRVSWQNKFGKLVRLLVFFFKESFRTFLCWWEYQI